MPGFKLIFYNSLVDVKLIKTFLEITFVVFGGSYSDSCLVWLIVRFGKFILNDGGKLRL